MMKPIRDLHWLIIELKFRAKQSPRLQVVFDILDMFTLIRTVSPFIFNIKSHKRMNEDASGKTFHYMVPQKLYVWLNDQ